MTPLAIIVLVAAVVLVVASGITAAAALALWWSAQRIRHTEELFGRIGALSAEMAGLTSQVARLRTQKAAKASPRTKAKDEAEEVEEEDPLLAGLSEEDKALFR